MTVEFDATLWLAGVDADSIVLLSRRGWSGPEVAEALATCPGNEGLGKLLRYARERLEKKSREDPSWPTLTCRVDGAAAVAWLERNRPEVAQQDVRRHSRGTAVHGLAERHARAADPLAIVLLGMAVLLAGAPKAAPLT